jgi:hypothetical protein
MSKRLAQREKVTAFIVERAPQAICDECIADHLNKSRASSVSWLCHQRIRRVPSLYRTLFRLLHRP